MVPSVCAIPWILNCVEGNCLMMIMMMMMMVMIVMRTIMTTMTTTAATKNTNKKHNKDKHVNHKKYIFGHSTFAIIKKKIFRYH